MNKCKDKEKDKLTVTKIGKLLKCLHIIIIVKYTKTESNQNVTRKSIIR